MYTYTESPPCPVEAEGLTVTYGKITALDGLSLRIEAGTVVGLLGPNGAGKTTLVKVLSTLLRPTRGTARIMGHDVVRDPLPVRLAIGLAGQYAAVDQELTGRENLEMVGRLYRLPRAEARRRAAEVLERLSLTDAADRRVAGYSGGMRRRLDLAASLTGRPPVLLLDEPTTGLDPRSRQELWAIVDELRDAGTTVLLTTQYLEEADRLAQRIVVVDAGTVIAEGTPSALKAGIGTDILRVRLPGPAGLPAAAELLTDLAATGTEVVTDRVTGELTVRVSRPDASVEALRRLDRQGVDVTAVQLTQPSLDDVFLSLTGRTAVLEEAR
ncbi:daunorubicin resistance protein DrrA family ABC transporter ATP-binding protein [Actinoplanes italicus]|uniref:ABC-2 type transport system ATP-binding protein n=1 Tax=Actinoplanes italicus TaxID=113567 RepID=A0A2T0K959_9ACTN|nr:ATP-binding cassette domain-containing protein [Actinoplanes italicus]PRX19597.1 ABC-2 type transport system ATP-binding protein [Actinoplanes italicus]GIE30392.1 daunorubicin resistance protein DrrA family ABC transporter ATP-binding protein [Actinoplanes italicus]